ncbi:MAG: type IV toxin-antitoxin system AbiEi family antitoxin domain-containing protein [Nocardioides sp.]|nr:type IV toxin-antitoxin system AbiEi family antitoxin domain-containing protein [Nocardioides sp.]
MMPPSPRPDLDGLVRLRSELIASGLTDKNIAHLVQRGALRRVRRGAYVGGDTWAALDAEGQHRLRARAVLRTAHKDTVLSHTSSILERGVSLWGAPLGVVHTSRADRERAGRRTPDWTPHRAVVRPDDVEEINGVRVTRAARAAVEATTILGVEPSLVAVNGLLRAKAMTVEDFRAEVRNCKYWPGTLTANLVLHLADPRLESVGEDRLWFLMHRQGLPMPEPQVIVRDETGREFARVDFAWLERGVFLEFDGRVKYERYRRDGESLEDFLMREKAREERICQLTGWTCIRVNWADLSTPEVLAARIRAILDARRPVAG